eukprot:jgi/Tetstr1/441732/TSEL_029955.t1
MLSTLAEAAALVASVFRSSPDNNNAGSGDNHGPQVNIGKRVAGVAVVAAGAYCAPIAAHAYKANTRSALGDDTVRMWLRPINQTVVFRVTGGGEAQYAMLDGKFSRRAASRKSWEPGRTCSRPARRYRTGGHEAACELGSKVECKVHPGKVSEATMEEWLE